MRSETITKISSALLLIALFSAFVASCSDSLVDSVFRLEGSRGAGTGFIVSAPSGRHYLFTAAHVCVLFPHTHYKGELIPLSIIKTAKNTDLCLIKLPDQLQNLPAFRISSREPYPMEPIASMGYGIGRFSLHEGYWGGTELTHSIGVHNPGFMMLKLVPGASGSPVFNYQKELVGVFYSYITDNKEIAVTFAVSLTDIKEFLKGY